MELIELIQNNDDKSLGEILRDLSLLSQEPDIDNPIETLEEYYNEQKRRKERNKRSKSK